MRFFFYYPTWNQPSGGNKQLRLMASLFIELGVESYLIRDRRFFVPNGGFDDNFFYGVEIPLAPYKFEEAGVHLGSDDVLILPEVLLKTTLPFCRDWKCRRVLNNQNGFFGLRYAPSSRLCRSAIEFAIANAPYVASLCREFHGIKGERIFEIPCWVTRRPFDLVESGTTRQLAVCYMPRKLPDEGRQVRELVRQTHPDVPWVEIDGLPEAEVAKRFRENLIFFAAQDLEGFGLPALEAMACGCLVTGFAGTAGFAHPYATPHNGLWAPDRNVEAAAAVVRQAIDVIRRGEDRHRQFLAAGRQTAERFTKEPVLKSLRDLLEVVRTKNYSARKNLVRPFSCGEKLYAYRMLYNYDRLGWAGQLVSGLSRVTRPIRRALRLARP